MSLLLVNWSSHLLHVLQACKESQRDPDFCVVARVEAFIAGYGLEEALNRAELYSQAGEFWETLRTRAVEIKKD